MEEPATYPWYGVVEGDSLAQGDVLLSFELLIPQALADAKGPIPTENRVLDLVVMSQTCDLAHGKLNSVMLCPRWDLWEFVEQAEKSGQNWGSGLRESLRRSNLPGYHLLNEASIGGLELGLGVVDFHEAYTAPTALIREFAAKSGKRLRLMPPYREHLAQAFARFFMRVGLPVDIPAGKLKRPPGGAGSGAIIPLAEN